MSVELMNEAFRMLDQAMGLTPPEPTELRVISRQIDRAVRSVKRDRDCIKCLRYNICDDIGKPNCVPVTLERMEAIRG